MNPLRSLLTDSAVSASLICALLIVVMIDRASPGKPKSGPNQEEVVTVVEEPAQPPRPPVLGVTPPKYDDMGKLLSKLGEGGRGYAFDQIPMEDFEATERLAKYDVIFWTCGVNPRHWFEDRVIGAAERPGVNTAAIREEVYSKVKESVRSFVSKGGTLYASDWRFLDLRLCFPELVGDDDVAEGDAQTLQAEVVEPTLINRLGSTVELKFDLNGWFPAQIDAREATVYLRGAYTTRQGRRTVRAPLLVKVPFGQGTIIFTAFHNEKINSEVETKLLEFLVFDSVLAKESAKLRKVIVSGGFSPQRTDILNASSGAQAETLTYQNTRRGKLVFALSFNNEGAKLRMTVKGPQGKSHVKEGGTSFTVEVPDAEPGEWTYTVTALSVPYAKFPYSVIVGD
ncbi:MAG: hypothetical protein AB7I30_05360 [Isosphaeraceae bacterium]